MCFNLSFFDFYIRLWRTYATYFFVEKRFAENVTYIHILYLKKRMRGTVDTRAHKLETLLRPAKPKFPLIVVGGSQVIACVG